ncbi:MAG: S9 family peptidase [Planctomycetes bacterium]|nr:S9 family peptidase [Planctomycetota bacterium]
MVREFVRFALLTGCLLFVQAGDVPSPPTTPKKPVTDEYHNEKVVDDYRWLDKADDPAVKKWTEAQNRHTRTALDQFPQMKALRGRVQALIASPSSDYFGLQFRGGKLFAIKAEPPKNQPFLITLKSPDEPKSARVVVDPNVIDPKGTTALDFYVPSRDARLVAVSLSEGGTEEGTVHVFEVESGKKLADVIPRVQVMGGGSLAWNAGGTGFFYTRNPRGNEKPKDEMNFYQQVYFHKLGTPTEQDTYEIGKDFPKIAEIMLETSPDGTLILASVQKGDGGEFFHMIRNPAGKWIRLTDYKDRISAAAFGLDDALYLHSNDGAPRGKILRLPLGDLTLAKAATIVPESQAAIEPLNFGGGGFFPTCIPTAKRLYVLDLVGGPSQIRVFDLTGKSLGKVPLDSLAAVSEMVPSGGDGILFRSDSMLKSPAWYRYDPATAKSERTALFPTTPAKFDDCVVEQKFATSKDGTKVPVHILRLKTANLNGQNPTLLYGYGGYGISMKPHFQSLLRLWLDQGGIHALANIRGGGEYGEDWRKNAQLTKRQNAYDDFAACAEYLIDKKYTNPKKLAIRGGSNGGLLMGVQLTQRPDLYRAVISQVGIYDMLRSELHPNGSFNVTEFGTVKDYDQYKALHAYSPYHNVRDGTAYPAVFLLTGENDSRVDPSNSRKMAARLQAATSSKLPVLLRVGSSGHGLDASLDERIVEQADLFAFLFQQLGVEYKEAP